MEHLITIDNKSHALLKIQEARAQLRETIMQCEISRRYLAKQVENSKGYLAEARKFLQTAAMVREMGR